MSDAPLNAEREALSAKKLQELQGFSAAVVVAYAALIDVVEAAMALSHAGAGAGAGTGAVTGAETGAAAGADAGADSGAGAERGHDEAK